MQTVPRLSDLASKSALQDARRAQTAFVDGPTFAGILLKDGGRSPKGLVIRAHWAVDQWPEGWQNREVLGGALYRDGKYKGAVLKLMAAQKLHAQAQSRVGKGVKAEADAGSVGYGPSIFSCHFLALAHHQLGNHHQARAWFAKAVPPKDAPWDDAMIDRYLRREVEAVLKDRGFRQSDLVQWLGFPNGK